MLEYLDILKRKTRNAEKTFQSFKGDFHSTEYIRVENRYLTLEWLVLIVSSHSLEDTITSINSEMENLKQAFEYYQNDPEISFSVQVSYDVLEQELNTLKGLLS